MATDEEKCKLAKLLQGLEVPEIKSPERCNKLIKEFQDKYDEPIGNEDLQNEVYENPYIPDRALMEENERKLKELVTERKWYGVYFLFILIYFNCETAIIFTFILKIIIL